MTAPELKRYKLVHDSEYQSQILVRHDGPFVKFADVEAYTHAAIAAAMMGAVKPLEWVRHPSANIWRCDTMIGTYKLFGVGPASSWDFDSATDKADITTKTAQTVEAAKAAAQADYQARILSALSIPTDATAALNAMLVEAEKRGRDGALEDAARWCDRKLTSAQSSRDEAKNLGASIEMQRAWLAVISHLADAPSAMRSMKGGDK